MAPDLGAVPAQAVDVTGAAGVLDVVVLLVLRGCRRYARRGRGD